MVLQGIEFWSNVADEEIALAEEAEEAAAEGRPPENVSKFYAKGALKTLIPLLTACLTKHVRPPLPPLPPLQEPVEEGGCRRSTTMRTTGTRRRRRGCR